MKSLTVRYSFTQFFYWAASTGAASFAAAYLLKQGLSSGTVGILLAVAGILSSLCQPLLASFADRARRFLLRDLLVGLSLFGMLSFALLLIPGLPLLPIGILYAAGIWSGDTSSSLLNALSVAYEQASYPLRYNIARGIGSAASALASLALGFVFKELGTDWLLLMIVGCKFLCSLTILGYPRLQKAPATTETDESCSILRFFLRYRRFCFSLLGILLLGMYLAMTESYLISILERLGGNSSHVGTALFISSISASVVISCFGNIRRFFQDSTLLKISALSFLLRAVLFRFAGSIPAIYLIQLLHTTSYAFMAPAQVYYASTCVRPADMVKGQAFMTAAYALGCSAGNFAGGQLLNFGVKAILSAGIAMTVLATGIMFLSVKRK